MTAFQIVTVETQIIRGVIEALLAGGYTLGVNGSLAYIEDLDTGERDWVRVEDVEPAAIDEWHEDNGQFGVGA